MYGKFGIVSKKGAAMESTAFKLVCIDDSNPFEFAVLDDTNKENLDEVHNYLKKNIGKYNLQTCKWLLLPIYKQKNY